ncbi:hypothetical protein LAWI1_G007879, partial [Lachnellula willkommii]
MLGLDDILVYSDGSKQYDK